MDDTDDFIEQRVPARTALAEEQMRLRVAFGDDVARRFLRLRGVEGEPMQEAVLERYAAKQALKLARAALALAADTLTLPRAALRDPERSDAGGALVSTSEEL